MNSFNPVNKTCYFRLDKYSCYMRARGVCSLNGISIQDLMKQDTKQLCRENSIDYCRNIAKILMTTGFCSDVLAYYCTDCDHFEFADGQHRVCVTAKLSRKGFNVRLNTVLKVNEGTKCRWCLMQEKYDREYKKFNLFQKLFKTKKYMKYIKDKDDFYFREFITKL